MFCGSGDLFAGNLPLLSATKTYIGVRISAAIKTTGTIMYEWLVADTDPTKQHQWQNNNFYLIWWWADEIIIHEFRRALTTLFKWKAVKVFGRWGQESKEERGQKNGRQSKQLLVFVISIVSNEKFDHL